MPLQKKKNYIFSDIALIKLPEPVEPNDVIKPISFACSSTSGMNAIAIGNGRKRDNDHTVAGILQYTELKTTPLFECVKTFPFLAFRQSVVCVKGEQHKSVCQGDSGGPLTTLNNFLIGVTSFSSPEGCETGAVQVFSRPSYFNEWIKEVAGVECKNSNI